MCKKEIYVYITSIEGSITELLLHRVNLHFVYPVYTKGGGAMDAVNCFKLIRLRSRALLFLLSSRHSPDTVKTHRSRGKIISLLTKVSAFVFIAISCFAYEKVLLPIPARSQWNFSGGYCGACSIQMAALYYGSYISQDRVRKSIGDLEILFGSRMNRALDTLSFNYALWSGGSDIKKYFIWLKENLHKKTPIIVATTHGDTRYSHIILAVGYTCDSLSAYHDNDTLFYNECHQQYTSKQSFKTWQDPTMHNYFDPTKQYGTIVSGIKDPDKETVPVYLSVDRWNEPTPDKPPVTMNAKIRIQSLTTGKQYILLKYSDHTKVPVRDFYKDSAYIFKKFVATHDTAEFSDSFMNNEIAIFRCVPDNATGIHEKPSPESALQQANQNLLNPAAFSFRIPRDSYVGICIYNCQGHTVSSAENRYMSKGNHTVRLLCSSLPNGTYYIQISAHAYKNIQKILIVK